MTEVERYVRDRVAANGEPCLMVPPGCEPSLRAVLLSDVVMDPPDGVFVLLSEPPTEGDASSRWLHATLEALVRVRKWIPEPPDEVAYRVEEGALDMVQQVEATALGVSLLQLALNRAGSGLVIEVSP